MRSRRLGRTDLALSAFGLGVMTFGGQTSEPDAASQLDMALGAGIRFFDTAENYPTPIDAATQGRSEEILGRWMASRRNRHDLVVGTKVAGPRDAAGDMRHIRGGARRLDRANLRLAVEGSLRRLGLETIDLYQLHWSERPISTLGRSRYSHFAEPSDAVPLQETLAAADELVREGKIRAVGVCNESPWGVMRYLAIAEREGLARIASVQNGYSLLDRQFELGLAEIAVREDVGLIGYSPLAGGTLTGKYGRTPRSIPGSRSSLSPQFLARLGEGRRRAIADYVALAREVGLDPARMALAFAAAQPFTTSVLMAASSVEQLRENLKAVADVLDPEIVKRINRIHDAHPNPR